MSDILRNRDRWDGMKGFIDPRCCAILTLGNMYNLIEQVNTLFLLYCIRASDNKLSDCSTRLYNKGG